MVKSIQNGKRKAVGAVAHKARAGLPQCKCS